MTQGTAAVVVVGLVAAAPAALAQPTAQGVTAYVTVASDYWSRGLSQTDGEPSAQVGLDYRHPSGFFAGGLAANVEYAAEVTLDDPRRRELAYYVGYEWERGAFGVTTSLSRYTYPGGGAVQDYDQLAAHVDYRDRFFFSVAHSRDFYGSNERALTYEIAAIWPLPWNTELEAAVGRFEFDLLRDGSYDYWNVGASKIARRFAIDLRYHANDYERSSYLGAALGHRWVLSVTYGIRPRT